MRGELFCRKAFSMGYILIFICFTDDEDSWYYLDLFATKPYTWIWQTGLSQPRNTDQEKYWMAGQPSSSSEDCGSFNKIGGGKLNDLRCNLQNPVKFVCLSKNEKCADE